MKKWVLMCVCAFAMLSLWASSFNDGVQLFRQNKPLEAIVFFNQAALEPGVDPSVYNYVGLCFMQVYKYQEAYDAFMRGISVAGSNKKLLYFNAGNAAYALGNFTKAEELFSYAVTADSAYAPGVLNRANSRVTLGKYESAKSDYSLYLELDPQSPQKDSILGAIDLIDKEIAAQAVEKERVAQEQVRIAAEEVRIAQLHSELRVKEQELLVKTQEEARVADEKRVLEEKAATEKRQKLLEQIAASVQTAEAATSVSVGTEGVLGYEYESELE